MARVGTRASLDDVGEVVALGSTATLPATVVLVPPVTGATVPSSAVWSDAAGATCVTTEAGQAVAVAVAASSNGQSVVEGLEIGDRIMASPPAGTARC